MGAARHLLAIVLLPGTVAVGVPAVVLLGSGEDEIVFGLDGALHVLLGAVGVILFAAGLALWLWTVVLLARIGKGTLAPWDPTQRLVVAGPYRHVRNPMISGVLLVLLGEAIVFGSYWLLGWAALFLLLNTLWFGAFEEPDLERRFGSAYTAYRDAVPRWLPRRRPGGQFE
jgi:protein-S-isoprenylcysteine O-methyltransferase Ste14